MSQRQEKRSSNKKRKNTVKKKSRKGGRKKKEEVGKEHNCCSFGRTKNGGGDGQAREVFRKTQIRTTREKRKGGGRVGEKVHARVAQTWQGVHRGKKGRKHRVQN